MIDRRRYITTKELTARTGLSVRYFEKLAKRVPFASQPEPGGAILFDLAAYDAWIEAGRPKVASRSFVLHRSVRKGLTSKSPEGEEPLVERLRRMRRELNKKNA